MQGRSGPHRTAEEFQGLTVEVTEPDRSRTRGQLYSLTSAGAGIAFRPSSGPAFSLGQVADVHFAGPLLSDSVDVKSIVYHWRQINDRHLIGFRFLSAEKLLQSMPEEHSDQLRHFEEYPAHPATDVSFKVVVTCGPGTFQIKGTVYDISPTGMAIDLPTSGKGPCRTAPETLAVSFCLPDSTELLELVGESCHGAIIPVEDCFRIGVAFDPRRTGSFERKQNLLRKYVSDRRRSELRRVLDSLS